MPTKLGDPRRTHRYQVVRLLVLAQEPRCWLRFKGCKGRSTTADHIITVDWCLNHGRPDLVTDRQNMHGACSYCNYARQNRTVDEVRHLMGQADLVPLRVFD